jgi:hypothetical protein
MEEIKLKPKSIIFSIIIIGMFFYRPPDMNIYWKILVSMFLFIMSYFMINWYDANIDKQNKDFQWKLINLYHLFILAPLLIYYGIYKNNNSSNVSLLLILSFAFGLLYHFDRAYSDYNLISIAHVIGGILGIQIILLENKPEWIYNAFIVIGIYAGLKHGLYLL